MEMAHGLNGWQWPVHLSKTPEGNRMEVRFLLDP